MAKEKAESTTTLWYERYLDGFTTLFAWVATLGLAGYGVRMVLRSLDDAVATTFTILIIVLLANVLLKRK